MRVVKCLMPRLLPLEGLRFGRLVVIARAKKQAIKPYWKCQCDCGRVVSVLGDSLRSARTRSCGCLSAETVTERSTRHGHANRGHLSDEYNTWMNMKQRCCNPSNHGYQLYGARGITVCDRWLASFDDFLADMGPKPFRNASIDRTDNNGPYAPENCRWATPRQQSTNRRKTLHVQYNGRTMPLIDLAEQEKVPYRSLWRRIRYKHQTPEEAVRALRTSYRVVPHTRRAT